MSSSKKKIIELARSLRKNQTPSVTERSEGGGESEIIILILAAGSSSRMGQSKQLLLVDGQPLLRKTVLTALATKVKKVVVVLGHNFNKHKEVIKDLPVEVITHDAWTEGMGSSLKKGVIHIQQEFPETKAVLIMVCDQPSITTEHLNQLIAQFFTTKKNLVASGYAQTIGVPAIVDKSLFHEMLMLDNQQGAKKILNNHLDRLTIIDFPNGHIDLDTPEDYDSFLKTSI